LDWFNERTMQLDLDAFILCEHRYEPGDCPVCDRVAADADEPIQRLRAYLAAHPDLIEASDDQLLSVPLS
jgi:hypothetical protein